MTVQQAAKALDVSPKTIRDLIAEGVLSARKRRNPRNSRGGLHWWVDTESVAAEKQRRAEGLPRPKHQPVYYVLPDIHEALASGDLKSREPVSTRFALCESIHGCAPGLRRHLRHGRSLLQPACLSRDEPRLWEARLRVSRMASYDRADRPVLCGDNVFERTTPLAGAAPRRGRRRGRPGSERE